MTNTPDISPEAVERFALTYDSDDDMQHMETDFAGGWVRYEDYAALSAELSGLKDAYTGAMEDKRMWKRRAEAAEAERDALKAELIEAADALKMVGAIIHNGDDPDGSGFFDITAAQIDQIFTFLARHQKETDT